MSDSEDLLGKADAFLKRYHPASAAKHDVPVLTEVIDEGRKAPASGTEPAAASTDLAELEKRLQQSIDAHLQSALSPLSAQIKAELETFIREAVARAVATEIARLRGPSRGP